MSNWEKLPSDEKLLIVESEIYVYLKSHSEYWVDKGYLQKEYNYDANGKKKILYKVTVQAKNDLTGIFTKRVKIRLFNFSLKEKINKIKSNQQEYNLLNLMEA